MSKQKVIDANAEECCKTYESLGYENPDSWIGWVESWYCQQEKLDDKDKELYSLRDFINDIVNNNVVPWSYLKEHKLYDENGNPTKLLTGE